MDHVLIGTDESKQLRISVASTKDTVQKIRDIHNTSPVVSAALGRVSTAAAIMGLQMKNTQDRLTMIIKGSGPIGNIISVSDNLGNVKTMAGNYNIDIPLKENGKLDVSGAVGNNGTITVIKDLGLKEPYTGSYKLVSGEIAEDITAYLAYSQQEPSAVGLGVLVDVDLSIKQAGGFIVSLMPGATEEVIDTLEKNINSLEPMTTMLENGLTTEEIARKVFDNLGLVILDKKPVQYKCDCSLERIEKALISIGKKDLESIIKEDGKAEIACEFCNNKYNFNKEQLENLLEKAQ